MTPEEINQACAELCGFYQDRRRVAGDLGYTDDWEDCWRDKEGKELHSLPSFTTSIDAAQKVFRALPTMRQRAEANTILADIGLNEASSFMSLTPVQWCEATLRAAGKWREE